MVGDDEELIGGLLLGVVLIVVWHVENSLGRTRSSTIRGSQGSNLTRIVGFKYAL